ncbi:MAG TPA: glycosyltransferase family 9 protein [Chlamydiales bacterium]|nr:glycosyltransferase family 9 protein [Chlamydiales bacterium]
MKIAILCASGIGDCLLFSTLGMQLEKMGWDVTLYSDHGQSFGSWLSPLTFLPQPTLDEIPNLASHFDTLFLQHDNSLKAKAVEKLIPPLYRFFGSHKLEKHGPIQKEKDYVCQPQVSMVENLFRSAHKFFGPECTPISHLLPPKGVIYRRFPKRIAIHPTASSLQKCWPKEKFFKLKEILEEKGFNPSFIVSPKEQKEWPSSPHFPTLEDLASYLYESGGLIGNDSGPGHLASLLRLPHLILGGDGLQMPLWRPGWHLGELMIPPPFLMRLKALRKYWHKFLKPEKVATKFINNYLNN